MRVSGKQLVVSIVVALALATYYDLFFVHPSTSRILYLQTVTLTRKVPLEVFAQYDPSIVGTCMSSLSFCSLFQTVFTADEMQRMQAAANVALGKPAMAAAPLQFEEVPLQGLGGVFVDASHIRSAPQRREAVAEAGGDSSNDGKGQGAPELVVAPRALRNAHLRFSSKHHVNNQAQEMWHYPLSFLVCSRLGLCDVAWFSANLVTLSHLVIGILSGLCFFRASKHWEHGLSASLRASGGTGNGVGAGNLSDDDSPMACTTPTMVGSTEGGIGDATPPPCDNTPSGVQQKRMHRNLSTSALKSAPIIGDAPPQLAIEMTSPALVESSNGISGGALGASSHSLGARIPTSDLESCALVSGSPPSTSGTITERRRRLVLLATFLFAVRNLLDTLDGVVARYERLQRANGDPLKLLPNPLVFGMNGHTLDTVCDFLGGFAVCLGILSIMWSQPVVISRLPRLVIAKIGCRQTIRHHAALPKWVAFMGLLFTSVAAAGWDFFMIKHVNLFDVHADGNDAIFALEQHPQVRLNQFLWSLTCADALFSMLTLGLVLDKLWVVLQVFVFIGYPWFVLLMGHSVVVWYGIVLHSPQVMALNGSL